MTGDVLRCGAVDQPSTPPLPPASGDCLTITKLANSAAAPQQTPTKLFRSSDGKTRVDSGNFSVITDPATQKTILLDHVKKEASVFPMPAPPPGGVPGGLPEVGVPGFPSAPPTSALNVKDLGKRMIDGQEAQGKLYTVPEPPNVLAAAKAPQMPQVGMPQIAVPQMPGVQGPKGMQLPTPQIPQNLPIPGAQIPQPKVATSEVWTNTKLQLPVATKTTGSFGEQTCRCKYTDLSEPHPSKFEIPADYKTLLPEAPKIPVKG